MAFINAGIRELSRATRYCIHRKHVYDHAEEFCKGSSVDNGMAERRFRQPRHFGVIPIAAASAAMGNSISRSKKRFACLAFLASHELTVITTNREVNAVHHRVPPLSGAYNFSIHPDNSLRRNHTDESLRVLQGILQLRRYLFLMHAVLASVDDRCIN